MKFKKEKVAALSGLTEVRFVLQGTEEENAFSVIADRTGVRLTGSSSIIEDMKDLEVFAQAMGDAWDAHLRLRPKLDISASGH